MSASGGKARITLSQLPTGLESQPGQFWKQSGALNAPTERDVQTVRAGEGCAIYRGVRGLSINRKVKASRRREGFWIVSVPPRCEEAPIMRPPAKQIECPVVSALLGPLGVRLPRLHHHWAGAMRGRMEVAPTVVNATFQAPGFCMGKHRERDF